MGAASTSVPLGSETLQPGDEAGTNSDVVGEAISWAADVSIDPSSAATRVDHLIVVVSGGPLPSSMIRNLLVAGMVTHIRGPFMSPRSTLQNPPGVFG